jgi:hypothetical protein
MDFRWVLLGFIVLVIVFAFLHVVTRMASERESVGRRQSSRESSAYSSDTITYAGHT